MRPIVRLMPLALAGACANGCATARALYVAVVHNSGAPPKEELRRIDQREAVMLRDVSNRTVVVLPVAILGRDIRYDSATSAALVSRLQQSGFAKVSVSPTAIPLPLERQPNEAVILWTRLTALSDTVRAHPRPDADYVLQVDVLGSPDSGRIGAVHAIAVSGTGDMVYRRLWNSHQAMYKRFAPKSLDDVTQMVAADLAGR